MNQFHGGNDDDVNVWYGLLSCVVCFATKYPHKWIIISWPFFSFQAVENGAADTSAFISPDVANFPVKRENGKKQPSDYWAKKAFPPKRRELWYIFWCKSQTADLETVPPWKQVPQANYKSYKTVFLLYLALGEFIYCTSRHYTTLCLLRTQLIFMN